mgnify:CR=1 FL=1
MAVVTEQFAHRLPDHLAVRETEQGHQERVHALDDAQAAVGLLDALELQVGHDVSSTT